MGSMDGGYRALLGRMAAAFLLAGHGCAESNDLPPGTPPVGGSFGAAGMTAGTSGAGGAAGTGPMAGMVSAGMGGRGGAGGVGSSGTTGGAGTSAGTGGTTGGSGGGGGGTTGGTGGSTALPPGPGPTLPEIMGECPEFTNGVVMVAGHGNIALTVGEGQGGALLFYWHGTGGSSREADSRIPPNARREILDGGGIIASFNGDDSAGTMGDCSGTGAHNIADFLAADQIAACAVRDHGIDSRRIYTTGCSAGGLQAGCMAYLRSSYLAAAAPNSGGIVGGRMWMDEHTPAIFTMHGGSQDMVIVTFSQTSATLDMAAKTHGSFVVNCDHGGSHCAAPADLREAAWVFMKDHPWGFTTSPWAAGIPAGVPDYCEIF